MSEPGANVHRGAMRYRFIAAATLAATLGTLSPASAATNNAGTWIGTFVAALLGSLIGHHITLRQDERIQAAADARRRTEEDEGGLKTIATALEEYAVDHNGAFPSSLDALKPLYYNRPPWIPESDPPAQYRYDKPALDPRWGAWDIIDNGAYDPTLHALRDPDGSLCTRATCRYIVYAESEGLIGLSVIPTK